MGRNRIIEGRVALLGDFNVHSIDQNMYCAERRYGTGVERMVDTLDPVLNNTPGNATLPTLRKMTSIIDLIFTILKLVHWTFGSSMMCSQHCPTLRS